MLVLLAHVPVSASATVPPVLFGLEVQHSQASELVVRGGLGSTVAVPHAPADVLHLVLPGHVLEADPRLHEGLLHIEGGDADLTRLLGRDDLVAVSILRALLGTHPLPERVEREGDDAPVEQLHPDLPLDQGLRHVAVEDLEDHAADDLEVAHGNLLLRVLLVGARELPISAALM